MKKVKLKYAVVIGILFLSVMATEAVASDIEEVVVVGSNESVGYSQPEYDNTIIEAIQPYQVFAQGGLGGFHGVTLHGTDVKHTTVYRNGIPVNDPGAGWYDFGTELPTYQTFRIISGPNGSLFGSSAMAGTVLMEDTFDKQFFLKTGDSRLSLQGGNEMFQIARHKGSSGSVRTDNTEQDWFENNTLKTKYEAGDWKIISVVQDYKYDYDNCWGADTPNDCVQEGTKYDLSARGDWLTLGYSRNDVEHNTGWESKSKRYFADANEEILPGLIIGGQAHRQEYNEHEYNHSAVYLNYTIDNIGIGWRLEDTEHIFRFGYEKDLFKFSVGNSFRMPNLYERYGDDWVSANYNLQPEKGKGIELSYDFVTAWYYDFSEGIDFDFNSYGYINTGKYDTKGIKFKKHLLFDKGAFHIQTQYTDSDKIRIAKYQTKLSWFGGTEYGWDYMISYIGRWDRGNDFDGSPIDDVSTFNFNAGYYLTPRYRLGFEISDIFDREFEILPNYGAGGRTFSVSLDLTY